MSSVKPETRAISRVHAKLKGSKVYFEKMANPYRGGTPDVYYEGTQGALWAEYKWYQRVPKKVCVTDKLSQLQLNWLYRANRNNVRVAVIGASPAGYVMIDDLNPLPTSIGTIRTGRYKVYIDPPWVDAAEVAKWIIHKVMGESACVSTYTLTWIPPKELPPGLAASVSKRRRTPLKSS